MADLRKIDSIDGLSESQVNAEPGRHAGLLLVITGTNDTGQTGTFSDLGRLVVTRNGEPLVNRKLKKLADMNDIRQGKPIDDSTEAGAASFVVFCPFFEKGHPNALNITDERELNIRWIPDGNASTVFTDLEVEIQSQLATLDEFYEFKITGEDLSYASAVSSKPAKLNTDNVSSLFIEDVDDTIDDLQFESSDRITVSNNSFLALQGYTNMNNRIEDDTQDVVEIENHTPGVPGSTVNRNNILRFSTSGAGNIDVTVCSMKWD